MLMFQNVRIAGEKILNGRKQKQQFRNSVNKPFYYTIH